MDIIKTNEEVWIQEVELINFQSHPHSIIKFKNGMNALIGTSNHGKTAVYRGIWWCLQNMPSGDHFLMVGKKQVAVKVRLSNGYTIERVRNKTGTVNLYRLYRDDVLIEEFTGFGTNVPDAIRQAHGIYPLPHNTFLQYSKQLEGPFMLSLSPSKRADVLGNLEEMSKIDSALTEINDEIRFETKQKRICEDKEIELIASIKTQKAEVTRLRKSVELLEMLKTEIMRKMRLFEEVKESAKRLIEIAESLNEFETIIQKTNRILENWNPTNEEKVRVVNELKLSIERMNMIQDELSLLPQVNAQVIEDVERNSVELEKKINHYRELNQYLSDLRRNKSEQERIANMYSERAAAIEYMEVDVNVNKYKLLYNELERFKQVENTLAVVAEESVQAQQEVENLLYQFTEALNEAEICPVCGQDTDHLDVEHVKTIV